MSGQSPAVDVEFVRRWLESLRAVLLRRPNESPQRLGLSQFFMLNRARETWDSQAGGFDHAIAVLAVDNNVAFTPTGGMAATLIRLAIPDVGASVVSTWGPLLTAIWAHQIDMVDVQALGIYEAKKALGPDGLPARHRSTFVGGTQSPGALGLQRGKLPAWPKPHKKPKVIKDRPA